jgi:prevent-host-death family protein
MTTVSVSEARAALPELLNRVLSGEEVTITRHGRAVAVVVRPDALRSRRAEEALASAARVRDLLAAGRRSRPSTTGGLRARRAKELVADVRKARDHR